MRCPDCNKFVSYDAAEPERDELSVVQPTEEDPKAQATGSVRIVLNCAECGTELKDAEFDVKLDFEVPQQPTDPEMRWADDSEWEPDEEDLAATDRAEGRGRGLRTFYGASATWTFGRATVGINDPTRTGRETVEVDWAEDIQASDMNELV